MKRCKAYFIKTFVVFVLLFAINCFVSVLTYAADFSWEIGDDVELTDEKFPGVGEKNCIDADMSTCFDGQNLWVCYTGQKVWNRYTGPDMDHLQKLEPSKLVGFDKPHGDDEYWLCGIYVDENTGRWYGTIHVEFNYGNGKKHERYIMSAWSDDQAATWNLGEIIITGDGPEDSIESPGRYETMGVGDQKMIVDNKSGYIYVYYMKSLIDQDNSNEFRHIGVARSPISANMRAGSWEKWYKGSWSQPGIGGHDTPLFSVPCTATTVFYSTYLEKYVVIGLQRPGNVGFITTCSSLEKNDWETSEFFCPGGKLEWYNRPIDVNTNSVNEIGQSFRIYCFAIDILQPKYFDVTFDKDKTTEPKYNYPNYSTLRGIGYTSEFNDVFEIVPEYAYYNCFDDDVENWQCAGTAEFEVYRQQRLLHISNNSEQDAIILDKDCPKLDDAFLRFSLIMRKGNTFGVYLKYISDNEYCLLKYEEGSFILEIPGQEDIILCNEQLLKSNFAYQLRLEKIGINFIFKIDENVIFEGEINGLDELSEAPFAIKSYPDTEVDYDDFLFYNELRVLIDNVEIAFDVEPQIINDRVFVPMRKIFELFGTEVSYQDNDKKIVAKKDDKSIILEIGNTQAQTNGKDVTLDAAPVIVDSRTLIPIRFVSEALGATVSWDGEHKIVNIASNNNLLIKLPKVTAWDTAFENPNEGKIIIDYEDKIGIEHKTIGRFSTKVDSRTKWDIKARIFRSKANGDTEFARIYELEEDIQDFLIGCYTNKENPQGQYEIYLSTDGVNWDVASYKIKSSIQDDTSAMNFVNYEPNGKIPSGYKFLKVELVDIEGETWQNQLYKVFINYNPDAEVLDLSKELKDYFSTLDVPTVVGKFNKEVDKRTELDCKNRIYRQANFEEASLIYELPFNIKDISVRTYCKKKNPADYYEIFVSNDGKEWVKQEYFIEDILKDPNSNSMYFANLNCNIEIEANYIKVVCLAKDENWANQIVKISSNKR